MRFPSTKSPRSPPQSYPAPVDEKDGAKPTKSTSSSVKAVLASERRMETRQQEKQLLPSTIQPQQHQQQQQYKTQIASLCDALSISQEKREKMLAAYTGREKELVQNLQKQIQTKQNTESHPSSLLLPAPSFGSDSLAYSIVTPPRAAATTSGGDGGGDSISSPGYNADPEGSALLQQRYAAAGGGSVDEYYYQHQQQQQHQVMINNDNDQYDELGGQQDDQQHQQQHQQQQQQQQQNQHDEDATPTIIDMHRKLLYVLSHPELFAEAAEWQTKVDMGIDPSRPSSSIGASGGEDGMTSFEHEFDTATVMTEDDNVTTTTHNNYVGGEDETKDDVASLPTTMSQPSNNNINYYKNQSKLVPPLPIQIFASDAEVVLPQAYTANQLFGIERTTGIELEAAGGSGAGSIVAVCQLFQRWLALMPNGDHENSIDPPGVTVMRISGGRYRVTGAHRVVWRWMNKFSFQTTKDTKVMKATTTIPSTPAALVISTTSLEDTPSSSSPTLLSSSLDNGIHDNSKSSDNNNDDECCADFDFGDLVTMTIVDVFETDADGKLLSYCPTFDNRAVHKTQESIERLRKGASMVNDHVKGLAGSPTGKAMNKATHDIGKMSLHAAWAVGDIVKRKIQEEFNKSKKGGSITEEEEDVIDVDYDGDAAVDDDAAAADGEKDIAV
jgi:hypothetical protein